MKSILISIRPEWVEKILNHRKTIELRKTAPKCDLPIEVYIYCTKNKLHYSVGALMFNNDDCFKSSVDGTYKYGDSVELMGYSPDYPYDKNNFLNGKVVAKFRLEKVDKFDMGANQSKDYQTFDDYKEILKDACLSKRELEDYLGCRLLDMDCIFFAWHISDLEVFDEPKELGEFSYLVRKFHVDGFVVPLYGKVAKAPQSWQYVEVGE